MDDIIAGQTTKTKPRISAEESTRRREVLRQAQANNRIEGIFRSSESDPIFEAFVAGDIEVIEIVPRLKKLHGLDPT